MPRTVNTAATRRGRFWVRNQHAGWFEAYSRQARRLRVRTLLGTAEIRRIEIAIEPVVHRTVADVLGVAAGDVLPGVSLVDDLAADSLDVLDLVLALESEFDLRVPDEALGNVRTYGDLLRVVAAGLVRRARVSRAAPICVSGAFYQR